MTKTGQEFYTAVMAKGASDAVNDMGKKLVNKFGKDILKDVAKLNFKNTEKILNN